MRDLIGEKKRDTSRIAVRPYTSVSVSWKHQLVLPSLDGRNYLLLRLIMTRRANSIFLLQGSLLKQLAIANKSIGGGVVVVLAERDKEEMEMDIAKLEFDFMGTSVICRSGSPLILADLKKVREHIFSLSPVDLGAPSYPLVTFSFSSLS